MSRLRHISTLQFEAVSRSATGWNGVGEGCVEVQEPSSDVLLFVEKGVWETQAGMSLRFNNTFRWSRLGDLLRLEHLRFGEANPVFLFDMALANDGQWRAVRPHECKDDLYEALLEVGVRQITVSWSIDGPKKQERICYVYGDNSAS